MPADRQAEGLVSVIIPCRNRRQELSECLQSIQQQDYREIETIVVDDCSTDDTVEFVRNEYPAVTVLQTDRQRQPAFVRNLGLRAARGEFVLFLDSDSELPRPDTIATMVRVLESDPELAALGGEIKVHGPRQDVAYGRGIRFNGETCPVEAPAEPPDRLVDCDYVATCNCFGRLEEMRRTGGFDPYFGFGGEDVDFVVRLVGDRRCAVSYQTAVLHKQSPRGRNPDETARYHLTRVRRQLKNAPTSRWLAGLGWDILRFGLFYLLLVPKLLIKLLMRKEMRVENLTGGYLILRAYARCLPELGEIRASRSVDFLSDEQMAKFQ